MADDSRGSPNSSDKLPAYGGRPGDADDAVTLSVSTTPGEWLVNTVDSIVVPMSMAEVVEGLRSHKLTNHCLVWRAGMTEWLQIERVPALMIAARLPGLPSAPPARPKIPTRPPPKPARRSTPPETLSLRPPVPSRRATLPGLPAPSQWLPPSRPSPSRPAPPPPRVAVPLPASAEDSNALAVYARPAPTISFELAAEPPSRAERPDEALPETLAPTTIDSPERRAPSPRNADLSVVAASQFREVQRSSKRLLWVSSIASAVAASLLTLWLASPDSKRGVAAAAETEPSRAEPLLAKLEAAPTPSVEPAPLAASPTAATEATPDPATSAKPKAKRKSRVTAWRPRVVATAAAAAAPARDPLDVPNPYDVKLGEDAPETPRPNHGSGLEAGSTSGEVSAANGSRSPGF